MTSKSQSRGKRIKEPEKTLIILDTNKARSILQGCPRYDSFDMGSEFEELITFIRGNELSELVHIAVTKTTLEELLIQKKGTYDNDIHNLNDALKRLKNLEGVQIPDLKLLPNDFDIISCLRPQVQTFIKSTGIQILELKSEDKGVVFDTIIDKALNRKPPFVKDKKTDRGFKDAVILETIKNLDRLANYGYVIILTDDQDFNGCEREISTADLKLVQSVEYLLVELKERYEWELNWKKYKFFSENEYILEKIKEAISDEMDVDKNAIKFIHPYVDAFQDAGYLQGEFTDLINEVDFDNQLAMVSLFVINDIRYYATALVDLGSNEINGVNIMEAK